MKIRISEIKNFIRLSSGVQSNSIIPIANFIKLEGSVLTKTNTHFFVQHKINVDPKVSMLIDAKRLTDFLKECVTDEIEVTVEGNQGTFKEGKKVMKFQSEDIQFFPKFPDREKADEVTLTEDILMSVGVAAKNAAATGLNMPLDYVHLTGKAVFASDQIRFYYKKFDKTPQIVLEVSVANIISQFQELEYYRKGNYDFFQNGDTLYGFIKSETKMPNITRMLMDKCPAEYFEFNVSDVVGFCDTVSASSVAQAPVCMMRGNVLSVHDKEDDFEYEKVLEDAVGKFVPNVNFAPRIFGNFFKSLGCASLRLSTSPIHTSALSVWDADDEDLFCLVIGLDKNVN